MTNYQSQKNPTKFPLISIIIPIYNAAQFLPETINSVIAQTYPNFEVLLINDGSTDSSKKICKQFIKQGKANIRLFNLPHQGVSAARNCGLKNLSGKYFCFLDADDLLAPTFISELFHFASQKQLKFVSSGYLRIVGNHLPKIIQKREVVKSNETYKNSRSIFSKSEFFSKLLDLGSGYNFCHMKLIHQDLKNVRFNESLKVAEDALYNFTILNQVSQVGVLQKPLYFYRVHPASTVRTFSTDYVKNYQTALQTIQYFLKLNLPDLLEANQKNFQAFVASHLFFILANFCCHQDNSSTIKSIKSIYQVPLFYRAIYLAPFRLFSPAQAIVLLCFKLRFYHLLKHIGKFRSKQNSK